MKHRFRDIEHLLRLAGLFAAGIVVFVIVRSAFVPAGFGTLGHFRPGAIDDIAALPVAYAGQSACADCHGDIVDLRAKARHKAIACESCHGALAKHAADPAALTPTKPQAKPLCVRCHAARTGKPAQYPSVDIKDHAGDADCLACHKPHDPRPSFAE